MPDTHSGYGIPVGGVAVTDDVIIQAGSGYDISCGVLYCSVPELTAADVADEDKRRALDPRGRSARRDGRRQPPPAPHAALRRARRRGDLALRREGARRRRRPLRAAVHRRSTTTSLDPDRIGRARDKALPQLGSVGGGNHFIEMQVDRDDGSVWVMIHCG